MWVLQVISLFSTTETAKLLPLAIMQKKVQVPTVGYFEVMVRDGRVATAFKGEPALPI